MVRRILTLTRCCKQSDSSDIRLAVRTAYESLVSKKTCCSSTSNLSFGCGDPTLNLGMTSTSNIRILDLGCGAGYDLAKVAEKLDSSSLVIGVDMTEKMLVEAQEICKKRGLQGIEFILGDIAYLPIRDSCIDAAISNCVINLTKSKSKVFSELSRILKRSGVVVISDIVTDKRLPREYKKDSALWSRCLSGAITQNSYFKAINLSGLSAKVVSKALWKKLSNYNFYTITILAHKKTRFQEGNAFCSSSSYSS